MLELGLTEDVKALVNSFMRIIVSKETGLTEM